MKLTFSFKLKWLIVLLLAGIVGLMVIAYVLFQISKSRTFQFFGELVARVETEQKVIALTFDDAPTPYTTEVLETLQEMQTPATFYMIGTEIEHNPEIGQAVVNAGHEVGNHSYTHQRFLLKSQHFIAQEIETTNQLIKNIGYTGEITFRPPNGKKLFGLPWYLAQHEIKTVMWDVEPDTYLPQDLVTSESKTNFLVTYTLANVKPGSIILLHPFCKSCESDRAAIKPIIEELKSRGYTFLTVSELIRSDSQNSASE